MLYKEGIFHPDFYLYKRAPFLKEAKIEAPILLHRFDGSPRSYMLNAVDENGAYLMSVYVKSTVQNVSNLQYNDFVNFIIEPFVVNIEDRHYITKREVKAFIENRFKDKIVSEPFALSGLKIEGSPRSGVIVFWYFTTEDSSLDSSTRGISSTYDEFLIDAFVRGYIPPESNKRAVITSSYRGSPHLGGARMVKLLTPLKPNFSNSGGSVDKYFNMEPLKYVAVPIESD